MKLKSFFAVALAMATLLSCTEKVVVITPENGTARIQVGLNLDEAGTRAGHYDKTPNVDELKIYNYALFIFNSANILEATLMAMPYSTQTGGNPENYDETVGLTFDSALNENLDANGVLTLSAGAKSFFAIVNAPYELLQRQDDYLKGDNLSRQGLADETLTFDDLKTIVGGYDSQNYGGIVTFTNGPTQGDNRGFMMTTIATNGYYETTLKEIEDENEFEVLEIPVGRAMAKVSLGTELAGNPGSTQEPNGTLDVLSYKIINNPKEMYIIPRITSGVWLSPYYRDTNVVTANYFESHNEVDDQYFAAADVRETNYIPVSTDLNRTFTYCIENANLTPKQGNSTIAVIKGIFTPYGSNMVDNVTDHNPVTLTTGNTFYRIWVPVYTDTSGDTQGGRYDPYYYQTKPSDVELQAYATAEYEGVTLEVDEFVNGICYYRLPLYNEKETVSPYTVKRNSYYMIDVISVSDNGYPNEDENGGGNKVDPDETLDSQSNIKVSIKVSDWDEIEQGGAL